MLLFEEQRSIFLYRRIKRELHQLSDHLTRVIEQETAEKVFMQTNQQPVQQMLIQVNRLLSYNQKVIAGNVRTKESLTVLFF